MRISKAAKRRALLSRKLTLKSSLTEDAAFEKLNTLIPQPFWKLPDLLVASYTALFTGNNYEIAARIWNRGGVKAGPFFVYVEAVRPSPPPGENPIGIQNQARVIGLNAGASTTINVTWPNEDMVNRGINHIDIRVDAKDEVKESIETNNIESWSWPL